MGESILGIENDFLEAAASSLLGGTVSELTGGKFANGAISALIVWKFNDNKHSQEDDASAIPDAQVIPEDREALAKFESLAIDASREVDASCSVVCEIPWLGPVIRGKMIHRSFELKIKALLQAYYSSEVSYKNRDLAYYGESGSVRADGVYGLKAAPRFIVELKTGNSQIKKSEVKAYQKHLPFGTRIYSLEERMSYGF